MTLPHPPRMQRDSFIHFIRSRPVSISVSHPEKHFEKRGIVIQKFCDIVRMNPALIYKQINKSINHFEIDGYLFEVEYEDEFRANLEACGIMTNEKLKIIFGTINTDSNRSADKKMRNFVQDYVNNYSGGYHG